MWKQWGLASLWTAAIACGSSLHSTQFRGPDGSPDWWAISCGEGSACQREAGEVCPHGYSISERDPRGRKLTIRCNGGSGAAVIIDPACDRSPPRPSSCDEQEAHARGRDFLINDPRERDGGS